MAYQYYLKRMDGSSTGDSIEDWIMAEEAIKRNEAPVAVPYETVVLKGTGFFT